MIHNPTWGMEFHVQSYRSDLQRNKVSITSKQYLYSLVRLGCVFATSVYIVGCQKTPAPRKELSTGYTIADKGFVTLGAEPQYVEATGKSSENPVLLFLHGGPGWPQTPLLREFNSDLSNTVTLVSWDQRGCGLSYVRNPNPQNVNASQLLNDAHELTEYLKRKYGKKRIYLAGFSWGSILGLHLIKKYPEDYIGYFGVSQVINLHESVKLSQDWLRQKAVEKHDVKMLRNVELLEKKDSSLCKTDLECFLKKYEYLTQYDGAIHNKEVGPRIDGSLTKYDDYKQYDWMKGFNFSAGKLEKDLFATDLSGIVKVSVPVTFLLGRHDWSVPTATVVRFVSRLQAPKKEIVWFEKSGHEPLEEEATLFNHAIQQRVNR